MVTILNKIEYELNGGISSEQYTARVESFEQYITDSEKYARDFTKLRKSGYIEVEVVKKGNSVIMKYFDNNTLTLTRSITLIQTS